METIQRENGSAASGGSSSRAWSAGILLSSQPGRLYHWGSQAGACVDFVLEWGRSLLAFEVKLSQTARYDDVRGLGRFLESHPTWRGGVPVYAGSEIVRLDEKIVAVPWTAIAR
jgi:hypothetical protein